MKECVFCNLIANKEPVAKIYEDKNVFIFLDRRPLFFGHSLLIPKIHYETYADLPLDLVGPFATKLQQLTRVIKEAMQSEGIFIAMNNTISQSVPHLHAHVVPRRKGDGLRGFFWPRQQYVETELEITQQKIISTWKNLCDQ